MPQKVFGPCFKIFDISAYFKQYAVFSFEICDKTIKEVALTISQVFIEILSLILDFRVGKDTETLSWLRT